MTMKSIGGPGSSPHEGREVRVSILTSVENFSISEVLDYFLSQFSLASSKRIGVGSRLGGYDQWTVVRIYTENEAESENKAEKEVFEGEKEFFLSINVLSVSQLLFRFLKYKMVILLDVSSNTFTLSVDSSTDGRALLLPYQRMIGSLKVFLTQLYQCQSSMEYASSLDLLVVAYSCETDQSVLLWEGSFHQAQEGAKYIESIFASDCFAEKLLAPVRTAPRLSPVKDISCLIQAAARQLSLMEKSAFSMATVFTVAGSLQVPHTSECQNLLNTSRILLNIVIMKTGLRIGDDESLTILANSSGGSVYSMDELRLGRHFFEVSPIVNCSDSAAITSSHCEKPVDHQQLSYSPSIGIIACRIMEGYRLLSITELSDDSKRRSGGSTGIVIIRLIKRFTRMTSAIYQLSYYPVQYRSSFKASAGMPKMKCLYSVYIISPRKVPHLPSTSSSSFNRPSLVGILKPSLLVDKRITWWWRYLVQISLIPNTKDTSDISDLLSVFTSSKDSFRQVRSCSASMSAILFLTAPESDAATEVNAHHQLMHVTSRVLHHMQSTDSSSFQILLNHNGEVLLLFIEEGSDLKHIIHIVLRIHLRSFLIMEVVDIGRSLSQFSDALFNRVRSSLIKSAQELDLQPLPLSCDLSPLCVCPSCDSIKMWELATLECTAVVQFNQRILRDLFAAIIKDKQAHKFQLISLIEREDDFYEIAHLIAVIWSAAKQRHSIVNCVLERNACQMTLRYIFEREKSLKDALSAVSIYDMSNMSSGVIGGVSVEDFVQKLRDEDRPVLELYELISPLFSVGWKAHCITISELRRIEEAANITCYELPLVEEMEGQQALNCELLRLLKEETLTDMDASVLHLGHHDSEYYVGYFIYDSSIILVQLPMYVNPLEGHQNLTIRYLTLSFPLKTLIEERSSALSSSAPLSSPEEVASPSSFALLQLRLQAIHDYIVKCYTTHFSLLVYSALLHGNYVPTSSFHFGLSNYREYVADKEVELLCAHESLLSADDNAFASSLGMHLLDSPRSDFFLFRTHNLQGSNMPLPPEGADPPEDDLPLAKMVPLPASMYVVLTVSLHSSSSSASALDNPPSRSALPCRMDALFPAFLHILRELHNVEHCAEHQPFHHYPVLQMRCLYNTTTKEFNSESENSEVRESLRFQRLAYLETLQKQMVRFVSMLSLLILCRLPSPITPSLISVADSSLQGLGDFSLDKFTLDIISPHLGRDRKIDIEEENLIDEFIDEISIKLAIIHISGGAFL